MRTSSTGSASSENTTVTPTTNLKGTVTTKSDPLTVRSGAGATYSRLGTLARAKTFDITGQASDSKGVVWYQLNYNGKKGFVSSQYVKATDGSSNNSGTTDPGQDSNEITFRRHGDDFQRPLNVRSGAGSSLTASWGRWPRAQTVLVTGSCQ